MRAKLSSLWSRLLHKLLRQIEFGCIELHENGKIYQFNGKDADSVTPVIIYIHHPAAYKKMMLRGSIGAAESYMDGDWSTKEITRLLELFVKNSQLAQRIETAFAKIANRVRDVWHYFQANSIPRAKKNILAHYDLGDEFFKLFLDPTMMYSCALYPDAASTQEQASLQKLARICQLIDLKPGDHILEIGTGWGGFAIYAATHFDCQVTTTTISNKQYAYVKHQIEHLGLGAKIHLLNQDYRALQGQYDKVVSIEMIEAVGYQHFNTFFKQCESLLRPGGLLFLQAIVMNDQLYETAKKQVDFIKKYIFPGGCLPSVQAITTSMAKHTTFQLLHLNDIGPHYVATLNDWHDKFIANKPAVLEQGFSEAFFRMWQFYFAYCAAGFSLRHISNIHGVWRRAAC